MKNRGEIRVKKILYYVLLIVLSIVVGWFAGDPLMASEKPSEYIGLMFSILAATIFAVVSIIGDPSMLLPGSRRLAWENALHIQSQIQKLNVVFTLQVLTLFLLVVTEMVEFMKWSHFYWTYKVLGGLAFFCFVVSLGLPFELGRIQRDRLRQEISNRGRE